MEFDEALLAINPEALNTHITLVRGKEFSLIALSPVFKVALANPKMGSSLGVQGHPFTNWEKFGDALY